MNKRLLQIGIITSVVFLNGCGNGIKPDQKINTKTSHEEVAKVDSAGDNIAVAYLKDSKNYIIINDTESGPYETPTMDGEPTRLVQVSESVIAIRYAEKDKQLVTINNTTYGPHKELLNLVVNGNQWGFIFVNNGMHYNINGKIFGPYDYYPDEIIFSENNYGFHYVKNGKHFITTKNGSHGPYDYAGISLINDRHESFAYELEDTWYTYLDGKISDGESEIRVSDNHLMQYKPIENAESIIIDGEEYGPYRNIYNFDVGESVWAFAYVDYDDEAYIQTSDQLYGPFETDEYEGRLSGVTDFSLGDNLIAIRSPIDSELVSIKINGEEQGPHITNYIVSFNKDNWYYSFKEDNKSYLNHNGEIFPINTEYVYIEYNGNNWAYSERTNAEQMFHINGTQHGPFDLTTRFALLRNKWAEIKKEGDDYQVVLHSF